MKVKIYTTPTCQFCKVAKAFFKENDVEFEEVDVAADQAAAEAMVKKTGQMSVPQIEIGDEVVIGFDEKKLRELLSL